MGVLDVLKTLGNKVDGVKRILVPGVGLGGRLCGLRKLGRYLVCSDEFLGKNPKGFPKQRAALEGEDHANCSVRE